MNKIGLASAITLALGMAHGTALHAADTPVTMPQVSPVSYNVPPARAADVQSIDGIIAALYDVISGGIGEPRDFNRLRSLFIPEARMMPILAKKDGGFGLRVGGVSDYIASSGPMLVENGFREKELHRRTEQWGELAHVYTTYEAVIEKDGRVMRGINSVQLMHDGKRWWIVSLMWEAERDNLQLAAPYLPEAGK